jgi:hypothetical protein
MGHIADALKKAESERSQRLGAVSPQGILTAASRLNESLHAGPQFSKSRGLIPTGPSLIGDAVIPLRSAPAALRSAWNIHPSIVAYYDRTSSITEQYRGCTHVAFLTRIAGQSSLPGDHQQHAEGGQERHSGKSCRGDV